MQEFIEIELQVPEKLGLPSGPESSPGKIREMARQLLRDAQYGTYAEIPSASFQENDPWRVKPNAVQQITEVQQLSGVWQFSLQLDPSLFPIHGGVQHLIGVLANLTEPNPRRPPGMRVSRIGLPPKWEGELKAEYRRSANDPQHVLEAFQLESRPLLAFTFKPRFGLKADVFRRLASEVLDAGFNVVEPDTRDLLTSDNAEELLELAKHIPKIDRSRILRFSPNVTLPSHLLVQDSFASKFLERFFCETEGPHMIKIDGGLDGFSSAQAIRRRYADYNPIITCYPLLRGQSTHYLPRRTFNRLLFLSGVDILYPGGRPTFVAGETPDQDAVDRFNRYVDDGKMAQGPMVSFAGETNPTEIHSFVHFFKNYIPLFLGGAVALNKKGYRAGADLCVKIAEAASSSPANPLENKIIQRIEGEYGNPGEFKYASPSSFNFARP